MNKLNPLLTAATVLLAAGTGAFSANASAVTVFRGKLANATALCQPALPAFDGLIRKRPLAVQNEGSSAAFVTCSFVSDEIGNQGIDQFYLFFTNTSTVAVTVSCTAVIGRQTSATYFPKSITLAAGATNLIVWSAADNGGVPFSPNDAVNTSCQLQPGVGINDTHLNYQIYTGP